MNPNTSLDLANGSTNSGTNIQLYKANSTDAQQWKLSDDGNGNISIISKKANICLTVNNSNTSNGTNIQANTCNDSNSQKFTLTRYTNQKNYTGIDISKYNGTIDWAKVAASNIGFVIIRAGWGDNWTSQDDSKFKEYVAGCEKYNIPYGVYLYSYAKNTTGSTALDANSESATSEAEHVLRLLKSVNYKPNLKQSVYIDMEEDALKYLGKNTLTSISDKFCSTIQTNGYGCGIYASTNYLKNYLNATTLANKYTIWAAEWPYKNYSPSYNTAFTLKPSYNLTNYKLWQFSDAGSINGISGNVDVDIGYDIFD
jgi:GH25 family lysozyme M1 (1,4-beta-N-acetylmuramidase)